MSALLVAVHVTALYSAAPDAAQTIVSGSEAEALMGHRWRGAWGRDDADGVFAAASPPPPPPPPCSGGACSSLVHYPCAGTRHYAEFNVPELPKNPSPTWWVPAAACTTHQPHL